ncbi:MAG: vitamin B12 dependent-methionine synthase activation domain-containing protein [Acidobacteriota bacterium]
MKERVDWPPVETVPDRAEVLRLQGIPGGVALPRRIVQILDEAMAVYTEAAEPRALVQDISCEAFAAVYRGEGRNAPVTPIEGVVDRAKTLMLFVATVGGCVTERIRDLFARNEPAHAAMLDSVASAATDRLALLLGHRYPAAARDAAPNDVRTLGYSPGYCGWHVSGQRALFETLGPEAIGVTLNASFLMDPLKSVSGVLVAGPGEIHRFKPSWAFCADCRDKPCLGRMPSLPIASTAGAMSRGVEGA